MSTLVSTPLLCQLCSNSYKDPRILSCLHSFCLQCINEQIHDEGTINCPSCNHSTTLDLGVASLPINIRIQEEVENDSIVQKVISSTPSGCESCEEESSSSVAYCKDCKDMLCTECWNNHKKMKNLRFHSIFTLDKLKEKSIVEIIKIIAPLSSSSVPVCPTHDDQKLCLYCTECSVLVCARCIIQKHNGHLVQELEGHALQSRTKILNDTKGFPDKTNELEQLMNNIQKTKEKIETRKSEIDSTIHDAFANLRRLIDQRERVLLDENQRLAMSKQTRLSIQLEDIQSLLESIVQCHSLASIATSEYSDIQLFSIAHIIHNRATSLWQQFTEAPLDICETPDASVEVDTHGIADTLAEFGEVADTSPNGNNTTAAVPCQRLGIQAKMKVRITTRNGNGKEIQKGGAMVQARLSSKNGEIFSLTTTDNGDGTYLVPFICQQLGQQQLFITVNNQPIQGSPFTLNIVPQRDYTKLSNDPLEVITDINSPKYIAFSDNGDMYVTSDDHCIYVYDSSGNIKNTIGSEGSGELQFKHPLGIDIHEGVVYVADFNNDRIHKLTTEGESIGRMENSHWFDQGEDEKTSSQGQDEDETVDEDGSDFDNYCFPQVVVEDEDSKTNLDLFTLPYDVKISPDGKPYVANCGNDSVVVFNPDWTISYVINGRVSGDGYFNEPEGIAFDLSGNVHVTWHDSSRISVFTPCGQFVREYGYEDKIDSPGGIAIDSSGYSLVISYRNGSCCVFDPNGRLIHSFAELTGPYGVAISPHDGSVWIADTGNDRLLKY